jgi:hypothetical protein
MISALKGEQPDTIPVRLHNEVILLDIDALTLAGAVGVPVDFPEHEPARSNKGCLDDLVVPGNDLP